MSQPIPVPEEVTVTDRTFRNLVFVCMLIVVGVFIYGIVEAATKVVPQSLLSNAPTLVALAAITGLAIYTTFTDRTCSRHRHHHSI